MQARCRKYRLNGTYVNLRVSTGGRAVDSRQDFRPGGEFKAISSNGGDTRIRLGGYAGVQNESICQLMSDTAGVRGGAREGRPRHSRICSVASSFTVLSIFTIHHGQLTPASIDKLTASRLAVRTSGRRCQACRLALLFFLESPRRTAIGQKTDTKPPAFHTEPDTSV